jgi:hypothetical protein
MSVLRWLLITNARNWISNTIRGIRQRKPLSALGRADERRTPAQIVDLSVHVPNLINQRDKH